MTAAERAQARVTARLLGAAQRIDWLSTALTAVAALAMMIPASPRALAILIVVLGILQKVVAARIALDSRLFEDLASEELTTADLDNALVALGLRSPRTNDRALTDRCRGARRLVTLSLALTAAQALAVILGLTS